MGRGLTGVGLGFRPELAGALFEQPQSVDFVEVVAESCLASAARRREACALAEIWPVVPHGVKLSLGSAEGVERGRARALAKLARELRAPVVTEHVAFVRAGGREIGHLTALPRTREAVAVVARNVEKVRRELGDLPLLLENVAWTVRWPDPQLSEAEFYAEIVEATGCELLLDVSNWYANAVNAGLDAAQELARFPLHAVRMLHVAGGVFEDGFYFDDHAHAVPEGVFELLEQVLTRTGPVPVLIERDACFPEFGELRAEAERARALVQGAWAAGSEAGVQRVARRRSEAVVGADRVDEREDRGVEQLDDEQRELAEVLTAGSLPGELGGASRWERAELVRSRGVLQRKRWEDLWGLLPRLAERRGELTRFREVLEQAPRPTRLTAVQDAWRLAQAVAAGSDEDLARAARLDQLVIEARFVVGPRQARLRAAPFVRRAALDGGRVAWVIKAPGKAGRVRLVERRASA